MRTDWILDTIKGNIRSAILCYSEANKARKVYNYAREVQELDLALHFMHQAYARLNSLNELCLIKNNNAFNLLKGKMTECRNKPTKKNRLEAWKLVDKILKPEEQ